MRYALSEGQWQLVKDIFPPNGRRGKQWKDHRTIVDGILWILRSGAPWRDLPNQYGSWKTVYERFRRWSRNGFWNKILSYLQGEKNRNGKIDWDLFCIDGSVVRAHKAAAGALQKTDAEPSDHSLGKSRGGFSTKVHFVCDGKGLPIAVDISPGQDHESKFCIDLIDSIRVLSPVGRPRKRPTKLVGDKGYTSDKIRKRLRLRGIIPVIPTRSNQPSEPNFDKKSYRKRNIVERCFGWLKEYRRIATRYEKLSINYVGMLEIGMILQYLK